MKYLGVIVFFLVSFNAESRLNDVRNQFPNIVSLEQAEKFMTNLEGDNSAEAQGYYAAMVLMKSRFAKNPFSKFKYFKQGKKQLDKTILENPSIVEVRYIRFLMQKQIPDFLGYNKHLEEDFKIISNNLLGLNLSESFKTRMLKTMLLVDNLSEIEKNKINQMLNEL
ncbi:hypothetical protein MHL31_00500 [Lutibacter sp. A80]|uniref:hypothetical protein n=1 Tax=Lutibacter sp. A80 TaxID=2918453 RepID=UPI001F068275|nr:hypothetical protein [Lutibacter sp. A80]UMB60708.1 hypothetical protein MHL31_00500 [Lutibacter sp. A80]